MTNDLTYTLSYSNTTKTISNGSVTTIYGNPPVESGTYTHTYNKAPDGTLWGEIYTLNTGNWVTTGYTYLYPFVSKFATGAYTLQVYDLYGTPYRNYIR